MAPVTQLSLVLLTTASLALARGHQGRANRHSHKRSQVHIRQAPYGYGGSNTTTSAAGNGTVPISILPTTVYGSGSATGSATASESAYTGGAYSNSDITETETMTLTSTITNYVTAAPTTDDYSGSSLTQAEETTCGGTEYVTVTNTVTVTAGSGYESSSEVASTSEAATTGDESTYSAPAYTTSAAPAPTTTTTQAAAPTTTSAPATSAPSAYTPPAYSAPAPSSTTTSAYAAPTGSTGSGLSSKAGCLYIQGQGDPCSALDSKAISWATNWGSSSDGEAGNKVFIPQLWGHSNGGFDFTLSWAANAAAAVLAGAPAVMGYNEPDIASQANLSPAAGIAIWDLVTAFKGKATIVSPSVTSTIVGTTYTGLTWLSNFAALGAEWDATGVHFYADCTVAPSTQITYLQGLVNEASSLFGKPVWVTEFGCEENGPSVDQIASFLETAVGYLEGEAKVAQYAAFNAGLLVSGGAPNAAGNAYINAASA